MEDINCWQEKFTPCQYSDKLLNRIIKLNNCVSKPVDINEITKAIYYAKKYHGNQMRQSGKPYYSHPLEVAYILSYYCFRTELFITAILHDVLEDTSITYDMIKSIFSLLIADNVMDLTRVKGHYKISVTELLDSLWLQKKYDILFIKLIDRLHNILTIKFKLPEKQKESMLETLIHFVPLASHFNLFTIEDILNNSCFDISLSIVKPKE